MPFGEELFADGTTRTTANKYSLTDQDAVRQRFTGYQKDAETGLDFAEARYYNDQHGRFTAVDPLLASGKSADPQTFNRYVYAMNRPTGLTDPTGLQAGSDQTAPEDSGIVERVQTWICKSFWCKITDGFNKLVRSVIGQDNPSQDADVAYQERKRTGLDKEVGDAVRNYTNDLDKVNETVVAVDPTGIGDLAKATVNNSLGRAPNSDVYKAYGNFAIAVASILPVGEAFKAAKEGGKHSGFLKNYLSLPNEKIEKAIKSTQSLIDEHLDKLTNPAAYVKDWASRSTEYQQGLIKKWKKDLQRAAEQNDILKGIRSER